MAISTTESFWNELDPIPSSPSPPSSSEDFDGILGTPPEVDFPMVDYFAEGAFDHLNEKLSAHLANSEFDQILEDTASIETLPKISQALAHFFRGIAFEQCGQSDMGIVSADEGLALEPEKFDPNLAVKLYVLKTSNLFQAGQLSLACDAASQGLQIENVTNLRARDLLVILQGASCSR